ncbi:uncharacterized protein V1510DRAFT_370449 [Dipodascopsis tothii]|uniref:uncharacterized protein n=1 Tax=Dipodascopsis tothii TaxID=44089 RepID=UPI0034CEED77
MQYDREAVTHDDTIVYDEADGYDESSISTEIDEAQAEWEESLRQLQFLISLVVLPFAGKFMGRKFAYHGKYLCRTNSG